MMQLTDGPTLYRALGVRDSNERELCRVPFTNVWVVWRRSAWPKLVDERTGRPISTFDLIARAERAAK